MSYFSFSSRPRTPAAFAGLATKKLVRGLPQLTPAPRTKHGLLLNLRAALGAALHTGGRGGLGLRLLRAARAQGGYFRLNSGNVLALSLIHI